jgi:hypothetical protein
MVKSGEQEAAGGGGKVEEHACEVAHQFWGSGEDGSLRQWWRGP